MSVKPNEIMRMMIVRRPEQQEPDDQANLELPEPVADAAKKNPGIELREALALLKKLNSPANRIFRTTRSIPSQKNLLAFHAEGLSDGQDTAPDALVESIFKKPASEISSGPRWATIRRKVSDSILVLKLAYEGGERPLNELVDIYRSMIAIDDTAAGELSTVEQLARKLSSVLCIPAPLRAEPKNADRPAEAVTELIDQRRSATQETAKKLVSDKIAIHKKELEIDSALTELINLPISDDTFVVPSAPALREESAELAGSQIERLLQRQEKGDGDLTAREVAVTDWAVRRSSYSGNRKLTVSKSVENSKLMLSQDGLKKLSANSKSVLKAVTPEPDQIPVEEMAGYLVEEKERLKKSRQLASASSKSIRHGTVGGVSVYRTARPRKDNLAPSVSVPPDLEIPKTMSVSWGDALKVSGFWPGWFPKPEVDLGPSFLLPAGVGELYVVRTQVTGYQSGEVSHIENILPGETRERNHRRLRQSETTTSFESETETEEEKSLETTTRAELEREVEETIERQFNASASAEVSGDYGKIEFTARGEAGVTSTKEESNRSAQNLAAEVVESSRKRVVDKVRRARVSRLLDEVEEINLHRFENKSPDTIVGVYQWLDKNYKNEVWSYGKRTLYDLIVPEPAIALLEAVTDPRNADVNPVKRPPPLDEAVGALSVEDVHRLINEYGVTQQMPSYPESISITVSFSHAADKSSFDNFYAETKEIEVPPGYRLVNGRVATRARGEKKKGGDRTPLIGVTLNSGSVRIAKENMKFRDSSDPVEGPGVSVSQSNNYQSFYFGFEGLDRGGSLVIERLDVSIAVDDYNTFAASVSLDFNPSEETINAWRRDCYAAIRATFDLRMEEWLDYENRNAFDDQSIEEKVGVQNPAQNSQIIRQELQRAAIEIIRNKSLDMDYVANLDSEGAPRIDFELLAAESPEIMFLQQAFEWENMTYVLYPYFYGRRSEWSMKVLLDNADPKFVEFLKAGAARVQVPVRPGFVDAVNHYMMTREPWFGDGMPIIGDPLYTAILDEIKQAANARGEETHEEDLDFDTVVPTSLIIARQGTRIDAEDGGTLPVWEKTADNIWREKENT